MESKNIVWRPSPTVCRCCFNDGCYKDISTEYFWMGKREIYSEMLTDTLDVSISYSQSGGPNSNSRLICEPCIARLRDASDFKKQVLECEKMFLLQLNPDNDSVPSEVELETNESQMKTEEVKIEKLTSVEDFPDSVDFGGTQGEDNVDDDDDLDDEPLTKLASKIPKKEKVDLMDLVDNVKATEKRKSSSKAKSSPAKKAKTKSKTEAAQPSSSGSKVVPKKQKGDNLEQVQVNLEENSVAKESKAVNKAKRAKFLECLLKYTTAYPFKWKAGTFYCYFCKSLFYRNVKDLRLHYAINHNDVKQNTGVFDDLLNIDFTFAICKLCAIEVNDVDSFKSHIYSAHNVVVDIVLEDGVLPYMFLKDEFNCQICYNSFETFFTLFKHMNTHCSQFVCECCGKGFATQQRRYSHLRLHKHGPFICNICSKSFHSLSARVAHLTKEHQSNKRYKCPVCDIKFVSYNSRLKHLRIVHNEQTTKYACSYCPKQFDLSSHRTAHVRREHLKELNHMCTVCGNKFFRKFELTEHMVKHEGDRIYQCDVCKKSYARRKTLREHLKIHSNDSRFKCPVCNRAFIQNSTLKRHMLVHNTAGKVRDYSISIH